MPEEIPGLTHAELKSIQLVTKVSSSFSFLGSLFIFVTFLRFPVLRNINSRLIFFMSIADLFAASSQFIGRWVSLQIIQYKQIIELALIIKLVVHENWSI